jgi:hypothetical protein
MAAQLATDARQQQHDQLHHPAGVQHQVEDGHVLGFMKCSRMVRNAGGRMVAASTQPMRIASHSSSLACCVCSQACC